MDPQRRTRAPRSDALANRRQVIAAAGRLFATRGLSISVQEVADAAGVGVGTVYRGFGSKAALVDALFEAAVDRVVDLVGSHARAESGWDGLQAVFRTLLEVQIADRGLHEFLIRADATDAGLLRARIAPLLADVVERARREGAVRDDLSATDVPLLTHTIAAATSPDLPESADVARRHLELLLKGIRAHPDDAPIPAPLSAERFDAWLTTVGTTGAARAASPRA